MRPGSLGCQPRPMGFFDDAPWYDDGRRGSRWDPPVAEFPCAVAASAVVLARTEAVAVAVMGVWAFRAGFEFWMSAQFQHAQPPASGDMAPQESAHIGLQFADGRKAANFRQRGRARTGDRARRGADAGRAGWWPALPELELLGVAAASSWPGDFRLRVARRWHRRDAGRSRCAADLGRGWAERPAVARGRSLTNPWWLLRQRAEELTHHPVAAHRCEPGRPDRSVAR